MQEKIVNDAYLPLHAKVKEYALILNYNDRIRSCLHLAKITPPSLTKLDFIFYKKDQNKITNYIKKLAKLIHKYVDVNSAINLLDFATKQPVLNIAYHRFTFFSPITCAQKLNSQLQKMIIEKNLIHEAELLMTKYRTKEFS